MTTQELKEIRRKMTSLEEDSKMKIILNASAIVIIILTIVLLVYFGQNLRNHTFAFRFEIKRELFKDFTNEIRENCFFTFRMSKLIEIFYCDYLNIYTFFTFLKKCQYSVNINCDSITRLALECLTVIIEQIHVHTDQICTIRLYRLWKQQHT